MKTEIEMDFDHLRGSLRSAKLVPYLWDGEDKNIRAFGCQSRLVEWYGQGPGVDGEPYRDRGFYTRELAHVSRMVKPNTIVEFGTSLGIGTCLLRWLNPSAWVVTVDINDTTFMPGDVRVPIGHLAKHQGIKCDFLHMPSHHYAGGPVDLCFIDAEHTYDAVMRDSEVAWCNRARGRPWAIVWHDHNERHPGVMQAVNDFCCGMGVSLHVRDDSDTVWIMGDA